MIPHVPHILASDPQQTPRISQLNMFHKSTCYTGPHDTTGLSSCFTQVHMTPRVYLTLSTEFLVIHTPSPLVTLRSVSYPSSPQNAVYVKGKSMAYFLCHFWLERCRRSSCVANSIGAERRQRLKKESQFSYSTENGCTTIPVLKCETRGSTFGTKWQSLSAVTFHVVML